ncbi:MAG: PPC domain-containing protein [Sedimentisphaerales bacterium]|nr:PPC domain-containing protein [Sedimentisphaerales bacterium]
MYRVWTYSVVCWLLTASAAWGQAEQRSPHIGYVYPAGGQAGKEILVTVGGQYLRGAVEVHITGEGVQGEVVQHFPPLGFINREQRELLRERLEEVRNKRLDELNLPHSPPRPMREQAIRRNRNPTNENPPPPNKENPAAGRQKKAAPEEVKMPQHPLLYDLDAKTLRELTNIVSYFMIGRDRRQQNRQIAETVLVRITLDSDATPGNRELRLRTRTGLTNPIIFQVGTTPEICELESNDKEAYPPLPNLPDLPRPQALRLPVVLNGQIMPGDMDRFRFNARQGQRLVIETHARSLIPYLADAVPGWFQATVAIYDMQGREAAFADDYRFNPDPVLAFDVPETGEYELEIRDAIYRGREDFVYRISMDEKPFITQVFPLGGQQGAETVAAISGWNMPETKIPLNTSGSRATIRQTVYQNEGRLSNAIVYAVDDVMENTEKEVNNTPEDAQAVILPMIINGRIGSIGDVDVFRFRGRAGEKVVAEVMARRLNSPLDSVLRLTNAQGDVVAWNDDHSPKDEGFLFKDTTGLLTHHADSYFMAELPADGDYYIYLADAQEQGGDAFAYRLHIAPPQPDFALRVTPSSLSVRTGGTTAFEVHVLRKDGFNSEIAIDLINSPPGFSVQGGLIPAGCDRMRMTLTAPQRNINRLVSLELEGRARIQDKTIIRPVMPADDSMQAFLYRHLSPAQEWIVAVERAGRPLPRMELVETTPICLHPGETTPVHINVRGFGNTPDVQLELDNPPTGVSLHNLTWVKEGVTFDLSVTKDGAPTILTENLIVRIIREMTPPAREGRSSLPKRKVLVGVLPAIPIQIVTR